jgi:hypothetical protein
MFIESQKAGGSDEWKNVEDSNNGVVLNQSNKNDSLNVNVDMMNNLNDPDYDMYGQQVAEQELLQLQGESDTKEVVNTSIDPLTRYYNSLVLYNLSALYFHQRTHQHKALQTMDDAIAELNAFIALIDKQRYMHAVSQIQVPLNNLDIQFLERPGSMQLPFVVSVDELTPPLVILSHFHIAKAELLLHTNTLDCAVLIQAGGVLTEQNANAVNKLCSICSEVNQELQQTSRAITHEKVYAEDEPVEQLVTAVNGSGNSNVPISNSLSYDNNGMESGRMSPVAAGVDSPSKPSSPVPPGSSYSQRPDSSMTSTRRAGRDTQSGGNNNANRQTTLDFNIWAPAEDLPSQTNVSDMSGIVVPRRCFDQCAAADVISGYRSLLAGVVNYLGDKAASRGPVVSTRGSLKATLKTTSTSFSPLQKQPSNNNDFESSSAATSRKISGMDNTEQSASSDPAPPIDAKVSLQQLITALNTRYGVTVDPSTGKLNNNKQFMAPTNQYVSTTHGKNNSIEMLRCVYVLTRVPPVADPVSIRAELLPILQHVGRDDATCWIQWAINQSNGFGFGFMGQASLPTSSNMDHYLSSNNSNSLQCDVHAFSSVESCSKVQLEYIRDKLHALDKKLSHKFDDDRKYKAGDREKVLLLNAVLAKVCSQLALRKDCGQHVKKMEDVMKLIYANSDRPIQQQQQASTNAAKQQVPVRTTVYDPALAALVKRFRLDFEEWDISEDMISTARKKINRYLDALHIAKEYVHEAELSCDLQLRRDSIKKICNLYMEIVKAPMADAPKETSRSTMVKNKQAHAAVTEDGDDDDEDRDTPPTESQLAKFSEEAIEEYETEDPLWVKRFGKLRALQFASRLQHLQVQ